MPAIYAVCSRLLLEDGKLNTVLPRLSEMRRQKTQRLHSAQKRAQSAATGLLTMHLLRGEDISYDDTGRPVASHNANLHISISHTGDWAFCVVADSPIGIDAQILTPYRPEVADRLFSSPEQALVSNEEFTRIWTHKEAFFKLHGYVPVSALKETDFSRCNEALDNITGCYYKNFTFMKNICVTACTEQYDALPSNIIEIPLSDL